MTYWRAKRDTPHDPFLGIMITGLVVLVVLLIYAMERVP